MQLFSTEQNTHIHMCVYIIVSSQSSWAYISYISNVILYERGQDHAAFCNRKFVDKSLGQRVYWIDSGDHPIQPLNYYSNEETHTR